MSPIIAYTTESSGRAKLHIQTSGTSTTTRRGRTVSLSTGDATFVLSDEPYEMEISNGNEMLVIEFPVASEPRPRSIRSIHPRPGSVTLNFTEPMSKLTRTKRGTTKKSAFIGAASVISLCCSISANAQEGASEGGIEEIVVCDIRPAPSFI